MQIQLVIGEQDSRYLNNLLAFLEKNYIDKVEIYSFSKPDILLEFVSSHPVHVILLDTGFGIAAQEVRKYGAISYLGEKGEEKEDADVIEKYKKPDLIFKDILALYAANGGSGIAPGRKSGSTCHMFMFTGFSGGTGASTLGAVTASYLAAVGEKTLYLNLETVGSSADFFSGAGNYNFETVLYALKSKRTDVQLTMESSVRMDASGVYYFEPCETAMYMLELTQDDIMRALATLRNSDYKYIIVDMNFRLDMKCLELMNEMDRVILVSDGAEIANSKFTRTYEAVKMMEEQSRMDVTGRMALIYNRFSSSKSSSEIRDLRMPVLGTFPPIKHALVHEIMEIMFAKKEVFEKLR